MHQNAAAWQAVCPVNHWLTNVDPYFTWKAYKQVCDVGNEAVSPGVQRREAVIRHMMQLTTRQKEPTND